MNISVIFLKGVWRGVLLLYISDRNSGSREKKESSPKERKVTSISYENYVHGIEQRGFDVLFAVIGHGNIGVIDENNMIYIYK